MAKEVVEQRGLAIRVACAVFSISESCYRYEPKHGREDHCVGAVAFRLAQHPPTAKAIAHRGPGDRCPDKDLALHSAVGDVAEQDAIHQRHRRGVAERPAEHSREEPDKGFLPHGDEHQHGRDEVRSR